MWNISVRKCVLRIEDPASSGHLPQWAQFHSALLGSPLGSAVGGLTAQLCLPVIVQNSNEDEFGLVGDCGSVDLKRDAANRGLKHEPVPEVGQVKLIEVLPVVVQWHSVVLVGCVLLRGRSLPV
jgi:hypothetical protein